MSRKSRKAKRRHPFNGLPEAAVRSILEQVEHQVNYNIEMGLGPPPFKKKGDPISIYFDISDDMPSPVITDGNGNNFVDLSPILGKDIGLIRFDGDLPPGKIRRCTLTASKDEYSVEFEVES